MLRRRFCHSLLALGAVFTGCGSLMQMANVGPSMKQFEDIQPGMTEKQVINMLGEPQKRMIVGGGEGGEERLMVMRWITSNHMLTVTLSPQQGVVGKHKI